jgi:hypothetical protein
MGIQVIKSEWHQVEKRYATEIDESLLEEIYPDKTKKEIKQLMKDLKSGDINIEEVIEDAGWDVDIDWDWLDEDDWWTDRKGGYEVTYQVQK